MNDFTTGLEGVARQPSNWSLPKSTALVPTATKSKKMSSALSSSHLYQPGDVEQTIMDDLSNWGWN